MIYAGGGILKARAAEALRELAELCDIHVVTTLMARGAFPDDHPLCLGHARHARQLHRGHVDAEVRPADRPGQPLRRPGHRQGAGVRPRRQDHPRRHRPGRAGQGPPARRAASSATAASSSRSSIKAVARARRRATAPARPLGLEGHDQRLAGALPADLRAVGAGRAAQAAVRARDAARQHARRHASSCSGVGQHQMWASQYWKFNHPYTWVNSGGLGTMGFSRAGGHRRQGRPPRSHGVGRRRRRLLPDDRAGAGHRGQRAHPGQDRHPQQRLPGHGAPVAGDVLRGALLRGVPVARPARLQDVGRGDGLHRHPRRVARGGAAGHRQGQRDRRPAGRHRLPHRRSREGVPDGRRPGMSNDEIVVDPAQGEGGR